MLACIISITPICFLRYYTQPPVPFYIKIIRYRDSFHKGKTVMIQFNSIQKCFIASHLQLISH